MIIPDWLSFVAGTSPGDYLSVSTSIHPSAGLSIFQRSYLLLRDISIGIVRARARSPPPHGPGSVIYCWLN